MLLNKCNTGIFLAGFIMVSQAGAVPLESAQSANAPLVSLADFSQDHINSHKATIEQLVTTRKWGRRGVRTLAAVSTVVTLVELFAFGKTLLSAASGEPIDELASKKDPASKNSGNRFTSVGLLLGAYAGTAAAQAVTNYLLRRYYDQVMQNETISWYVFTQAFYKVNSAEIKQQIRALQDAPEISLNAYQQQTLISAINGLVVQLEKIIAFMEFKLEKMVIKNRPEARALVSHLSKSAALFVADTKENIEHQFSLEKVLQDLRKLESTVERELLHFSRLEGDVSMSEQQYNALLQSQSA